MQKKGDEIPPEDVCMKTEYTRTLDKAYKFYRKSYVQDVKSHPMLHEPDFVFVASTVLLSMKKDRIYYVKVILHQLSFLVKAAYCTCPAGLSGCCNHVTGTLYCLEDYIYQDLQEEERKGCTDRLQVWNQPTGCPTRLHMALNEYPSCISINEWDCWPLLRRIIDPNKAHETRKTVFARFMRRN